MALVKCNECGKKISDTAKTCPHCGAKNLLVQSSKKKGIIVVCSLIGIIAIVVTIFLLNKSPLDVYKNSMIDALEDYRAGKIDRKELMNKMDGISDKLRDYDGNDKESFKALSISIEAGYISSKVLSRDATDKEIREWIAEIKEKY